jgi:hypothetical protein
VNVCIITAKKNDLHQLERSRKAGVFETSWKTPANDPGHFAEQWMPLHLRYKNKIV